MSQITVNPRANESRELTQDQKACLSEIYQLLLSVAIAADYTAEGD